MSDYKKIFNFLKLDTIVDHISDLIEAKIEVYKVELKYEAAKVGSRLITFIILSFILFMVLLFLSFTLSTFLNDVLESRFWGYAIVTAFYTLIFVLFILLNITEVFRRKFEEMLIGNEESDTSKPEADTSKPELDE